jgi:alpha/beta superfamily hydrolase
MAAGDMPIGEFSRRTGCAIEGQPETETPRPRPETPEKTKTVMGPGLTPEAGHGGKPRAPHRPRRTGHSVAAVDRRADGAGAAAADLPEIPTPGLAGDRCSVMRFNFRGVGRSQGRYDGGIGEIGDAAAALDWMQAVNPGHGGLWIAGYSFGAFIGMQLLMRRPEISGWVSVAPPANHYDFGFLAPCPCGGLMRMPPTGCAVSWGCRNRSGERPALPWAREQAAIAIAIVSAKPETHFRSTPGGYFHGHGGETEDR